MPNKESIDEIVSKEALTQVDELLKKLAASEASMSALIEKTLAFNEAVGKSGALKEFNTNATKSKKATEELNAETKVFIQNTKQIETLQAKLSAATSDEAKEIAKLRAEIEAVNRANKEAVKAANTQLDAYQKLEQQYKEAAKAAKALAAQDDKGAKAAAQHAYDLQARLKAIDKSVGDNRRNVGNYAESFKEALGSAIPGFGQLQNSITGVTGAANGLTAAGGGWLILINIVVQLINYLKEFDPVADAVEEGMAALGAVFNVVNKNIIEFFTSINSVGDVFESFGNFIAHPLDSLKSFADELARAASNAADLTAAQDDLEDAMVNQEVATAKAEQKISQLILEARNKELSPEERKKKLDLAAKIDQDNFNQQTVLARARLQIALKDAQDFGRLNGEQIDALKNRGTEFATELFKQGKIEKRHRDAIHDAELAIVAIQKESVDRQTKIQNRKDQADEEATRKAEQNAKNREAALRKAAEAEKRRLQEIRDSYKDVIEMTTGLKTFLDELDGEKQKRALDLIASGFARLKEVSKGKFQLELIDDKGETKKLGRVTQYTDQMQKKGRDLLKKAQENIDADRDKTREKRRKEDLAELETIRTYGGQALDVLGGAMQAVYDRRKNAIQEQIDQIEELKNAEIKRVAESVASEEEKAAKIAVINARAQAERERLEKKQRELDQKKAIADKAKAVFDIVINTAVAVSKALIEKTALVPLIAALGAAQLATVLAQPIPKYAKGTDRAKGGPAIVGEQGRELVVTPQGELIYTPDKPTLTYLKEGSRVIPHNKLKDIALGNLSLQANGRLINSQALELAKVTQATTNGADKITKAIKSQTRQVWTRDGLLANYNYNKRLDDYFKRNLK